MSGLVAIVQARMGSERLPGKVLREVLGRPLLWYLARQMEFSERLDDFVIATSDGPADDAIERFAGDEGLKCFRGSEHDVLDRYVRAAAKFDARWIVRITGDCPLLSPAVVDGAVENHLASGCDYTVNNVPDVFPRGYDVEVFSRDSLERAHSAARAGADREHVTRYIYTHKDEFSVNVYSDTDFPHFHAVRLCVDTPQDFEMVGKVIEGVYEKGRPMRAVEVFEFLEANPDILRINADVAQKEITGEFWRK